MAHPRPNPQAVNAKKPIRLTLYDSNTLLTNLLGLRISDLLLIHPVFGFLVLGIIDLLGWVHGRFKVLEEAAALLHLAVERDGVCVVGAGSEYPMSPPDYMLHKQWTY